MLFSNYFHPSQLNSIFLSFLSPFRTCLYCCGFFSPQLLWNPVICSIYTCHLSPLNFEQVQCYILSQPYQPIKNRNHVILSSLWNMLLFFIEKLENNPIVLKAVFLSRVKKPFLKVSVFKTYFLPSPLIILPWILHLSKRSSAQFSLEKSKTNWDLK